MRVGIKFACARAGCTARIALKLIWNHMWHNTLSFKITGIPDTIVFSYDVQRIHQCAKDAFSNRANFQSDAHNAC